MNKQELLRKMSESQRPRRQALGLLPSFLVLLCFAFFALGINYHSYGLRTDFAQKLLDGRYLYEGLSLLLVVVLSAWGLVLSTTPGAPFNKIKKIASLVFILWPFVILGFFFQEAFQSSLGQALGHFWGQRCVTEVIIIPFTILPFVLYLALGRSRFALKYSITLTFMFSMSVGLLGGHLSCPLDGAGHVLGSHILPAIINAGFFTLCYLLGLRRMNSRLNRP